MVDDEEARDGGGEGKCEVPELAMWIFLAALFSAEAWPALEHLAFFLEMPFGISNLQLGDLQNTR